MKTIRPPRFLIPSESRWKTLVGSLAVLFARSPLHQPTRIYRRRVDLDSKPPIRAVTSSLLLHIGIGIFLARLPILLLYSKRHDFHRARNSWNPSAHVLMVNTRDLAQILSALGDQSASAPKPPAPRATVARDVHRPLKSSLVAQSKAAPPDNDHQTLIQPDLPMSQRIPFDLRLPNIVSRAATPPALPAVAAPPRQEAQVTTPVVPKILLPPVQNQPAQLPEIHLTATAPMEAFSLTQAPAPWQPAPAEKPAGNAATTNQGAEKSQPAGTQILALSVNPSAAIDQLPLPPGNRLGSFAIAPDGTSDGTASESAVGNAPPGGDQSGSTGSATVSVSIGEAADGHGASGSAVNGRTGEFAGAPPVSLDLDAAAADLVYPVTMPTMRKDLPFVVTSGPTGGGGIHAYGVLRSGKVFTIYLSMPRSNWILEYCVRKAASPQGDPPVRTVQWDLDPGLTAPAAQDRFSFKWPGRQDYAGNDMIILHGVIRADGTVADLDVYQGIEPLMDRAAVAAFRKWKFKPAIKSGKPVDVEILLGIPVPTSGS